MVEWVEIGNARLACGDCLEILPTLPKVDAVVTDPPYAVSVSGSVAVNMLGKGSRRLDFFDGDDDWHAMNKKVAKAVGLFINLEPVTVLAWCSHRQIGFINEMLEQNEYRSSLLFWRKSCPPPAPPNTGFSSAVEQCVYGRKSGRHWGGGQYDPNIFECDNYRFGQPGKFDHPTQKPIALIEWQIEKTTARDQTIIDPFMGSGTTGVACMNLGRKFIGIEIERKYFDIACERIDQAQRQLRICP